jgi:Putative Ig domain
MRLFLIFSLALFLAGCPSSKPSALVISTSSFPQARVGTSYSLQLTATGGTAPYSWNVLSGAFPEGIVLSSSGLVSGTPKASGSFEVVVEVTDSKSLTKKVKVKGRV